MQMLDKSGISFILHLNGARRPGGLLHVWLQVSEMVLLTGQNFQMERYS